MWRKPENKKKLTMSDSDIFLKLAKKQETTAPSPPSPTPSRADKEPQISEEINESAQTNMRARIHATKISDAQINENPTDQAHTRTPIEQNLKRTLLNKRRMSTFTFRFKPEELEALLPRDNPQSFF